VPEDCSIDDFFEELTFLNLKDILVASNNFKLAKSFFGELNKDKFIEVMDDLNTYRRKIAHAKSTFSDLDLVTLIDYVRLLCQGDVAKEIKRYLKNEEYKNAKEIPPDFFEEYECQNNLPSENYDLDGGFVGRAKDIQSIRKLIKSDQDRIITLTGAGGVGKTADALRVAYSFLPDPQNPFEAIIWFSAKTSKLTDEGIVPLAPSIRSDIQLIEDILGIVDQETLKNFKKANVPSESFKKHLYNLFSSQKCLLIVDNLETIIRDDALISFIKDIPRPSQVLITSRKGLGEIERRYPLTDMLEKDAIQLFRIIAKERNRLDLLRLKDETISDLVKRVRCYPLLIKWSIGQVCLGKDIDIAFSQIFAGESEIAKFSFNDVFLLLSENAKIILFSMIVYGDKPVSRYVLMHLANLTDDQFEDAIKELIVTSFVFPESKETESGIVTEYSMLSLTRGFIENKLDEDEKIKEMLLTRYYHLSEQSQDFERSKSSYSQSLFSLGIKTPEERVAFNYVKAAKNFFYHNDMDKAEENYEQAIKIAPKFSYAIGEFSKFEFNRGHVHKALELAKNAIQVNPENYHAWFNYGISLKKSLMFPEAIEALQKAKELNPKHLPIFNELGRAYTMIGDYETAQKEFMEALREEKYPNYRHIIMTLQFLADNYDRMADSFRFRRDSTRQIANLKLAFETISKALEIDSKDMILWKFYRRICKNLGIALSINMGFAEGKPYLEKSLQTVHSGKKIITPDSKIVAEACSYLATFSMKENDKDIKQIENWINTGLANCTTDSTQFERLNHLKKELVGETTSRGNVECRKYGGIKFYNTLRKFGIIIIADETYLFFASGLRQRIPQEELDKLDGSIVSCILVENTEKKGQMIASDIVFEKEWNSM
jgi:LuxR family glucitol operon transcriptional activator